MDSSQCSSCIQLQRADHSVMYTSRPESWPRGSCLQNIPMALCVQVGVSTFMPEALHGLQWAGDGKRRACDLGRPPDELLLGPCKWIMLPKTHSCTNLFTNSPSPLNCKLLECKSHLSYVPTHLLYLHSGLGHLEYSVDIEGMKEHHHVTKLTTKWEISVPVIIAA